MLEFTEEEQVERMDHVNLLWEVTGRPLSKPALLLVMDRFQRVPTPVLIRVVKDHLDQSRYPPTVAELLDRAAGEGVDLHPPAKVVSRQESMTDEEFEQVLKNDYLSLGWSADQPLSDYYDWVKDGTWPDEIAYRHAGIKKAYLEFIWRKVEDEG